MMITLTLDYEIFGDGSGDVRRFIIEPTMRLLKILEERDIPMTVFFELEEYLVFRRFAKAIQKRFGYDPAQLIEEQLEALIRAGHEIGFYASQSSRCAGVP